MPHPIDSFELWWEQFGYKLEPADIKDAMRAGWQSHAKQQLIEQDARAEGNVVGNFECELCGKLYRGACHPEKTTELECPSCLQMEAKLLSV